MGTGSECVCLCMFFLGWGGCKSIGLWASGVQRREICSMGRGDVTNV